jgi:hypothetical protein
MTDSLFDRCNVVADKYGVSLSDVVVQYTKVRLSHERQLTYLPVDTLLEMVDTHFKVKYEKSRGVGNGEKESSGKEV